MTMESGSSKSLESSRTSCMPLMRDVYVVTSSVTTWVGGGGEGGGREGEGEEEGERGEEREGKEERVRMRVSRR